MTAPHTRAPTSQKDPPAGAPHADHLTPLTSQIVSPSQIVPFECAANCRLVTSTPRHAQKSDHTDRPLHRCDANHQAPIADSDLAYCSPSGMQQQVCNSPGKAHAQLHAWPETNAEQATYIIHLQMHQLQTPQTPQPQKLHYSCVTLIASRMTDFVYRLQSCVPALCKMRPTDCNKPQQHTAFAHQQRPRAHDEDGAVTAAGDMKVTGVLSAC